MVLIVLVGAMIRMAYLPVHGFDADEITSIATSQKPLGLLASDFAGTVIEVSPKLYHMTYHFWLAAGGVSELAARLPNILLDMALAAFVMLILARRSLMRAALIFGTLWAINPTLIWVSGMARMYTMFALLATVTWLCLLEAMANNQRRWWIAYGVALLVTIFTHVLSILVLALCMVFVTGWAIARGKPYGLPSGAWF